MHEDLFRKPNINLQALRLCCYTLGAGAIGFFMRWIQHQMAFDENGLVDGSVWNVLLPFYMVIAAYLGNNYLRNLKEDGYSVSPKFNEALYNNNGLIKVISVLSGLVMAVGGAVLIASCETDKSANLLRIVGILGILSGVCIPLFLRDARKEAPKINLTCIIAFIPMLMYAIWLLATYKMNDINPVVWSYSIEILTVCCCIAAFFRLAGFPFAAAKGRKALFFCMASFFMCFMSLADSRYIGMQLMIIATAIIMITYVWIFVDNFVYVEPQYEDEDNGGFEDLRGRSRKRRVR